jgi:hypothetical protein
MLWKTHRRISHEVLTRLGKYQPPEVFQSFMNGTVAPDKWEDFPHHYGKSESIKQNLMKSRRYLLQDDLQNAFFHLGVALHYIQDSYTSMSGRYVNHHRWEENIEDSKLIEDAKFTDRLKQIITYYLGKEELERNRCLGLADALSKKACGRDSTLYLATLSGQIASVNFAAPMIDLNLAFRASYVVTESVLSPKNCPEVENKLRRLLLNHETFLQKAEVDFSNKIIKLFNERVGLEKRKLSQSGIIPKIKNLILGIRISLKTSELNSNYNHYAKQEHLVEVVKEYNEAVIRTVYPYSGWYNLSIPSLSPNTVSKELLTIQSLSKVLGMNKQALKESMHKFKISSYQIENTELVKRSEVDSFLTQISVKDFSLNTQCKSLEA